MKPEQTIEQESNSHNNPFSAEKEILYTKNHQIKPIAAGVVGALLLVSCIAFYVLKIHFAVAVDVGLTCMGFALYNATAEY